MLKTLHLFAGAGGGLLCDLILGHQPIAAVEWDPYACAVLRERRDEGWFPGLQVHEGDVRLFDPSRYAGKVDCIHAGFPCQDISTAGKGAGITGARSGLVSEVFRAIDAIRPEFVFLENSPAIRTRGRHVVLGELVARGYAYRDGILAASDVGACHKRARWWCLAYSKQPQTNSIGGTTERGRHPMGWDKQTTFSEDREASPDSPIGRIANVPDRSREDVANPESVGWNDGNDSQLQRPPSRKKHPPTSTSSDFNNVEKGWWSLEPDVGRVAHGVANRVDRIKAIGNGQVPLQAATAWCLLGGPQ